MKTHVLLRNEMIKPIKKKVDNHSFKMNHLLVASIILALCQVHGRGHPRKKHPYKESTTLRNEPKARGRPPLCSKSICEKINTVGKDPFRDFPDLPLWLPEQPEVNPYVYYAYEKWRVNNKSVLDPTKNCTSEPIDSLDGVGVGFTKDNQIAHLFPVEMVHSCIIPEKDCDGKFYDGECLHLTRNLITINQSGVVIGDDLGSNWDDNDDIICLNC